MLQVYAVYFKCNKHLIREYPNLKNYTAEIYQMPGEHVYHSLTHLVILTIMMSIIDMTGVNKEIDMTGVNNNKKQHLTSHGLCTITPARHVHHAQLTCQLGILVSYMPVHRQLHNLPQVFIHGHTAYSQIADHCSLGTIS